MKKCIEKFQIINRNVHEGTGLLKVFAKNAPISRALMTSCIWSLF
jgi:hypothetical protein